MKSFSELDDQTLADWREHPVTRAFVKDLVTDYERMKRATMSALASNGAALDSANFAYIGGQIYAWRLALYKALGAPYSE